MNNDQVKGRQKYKQVRGRIKASAERFFFGVPSLENEGRFQSAAGKLQEGPDDIDLESGLAQERYRNLRQDHQDDREDGGH